MHSRGTWYAVSVCVAFFVYLTAVAETLENDAICIVLGGVDYGFGIKGIVNRLAGEVYFGAAAGGKDLWDVRLAQKGPLTNEYCHVSNRSPARSLECVREDRGLRLYWRELDLPGDPGVMDVVVDIRLEDSGASDWTIAIHNRSKIWAQHTVDYPIIRKIMPEGSGTALLPWKNLGGRLFHAYDSRKQDRRGSFCSPGAYLPMAAFMRDGAGLYFAAHDGESRIKKLCVRIGPDVCFSTILENAGCVGKAADSPNYAVTIAPFCGNWWEAAHIYRAWAVRQKWCRKGKVAFRKDFPRIAAEASLWPTTGGSASNMLARIENMKKVWPAEKIVVGWSNWYQTQPGNRMNPEFFPMRDPQIPDVIQKGKACGFHFMPYINGRIWDTSAIGFIYAAADATVDENGDLYEERYSGENFGVMCPFCPRWQKAVYRLGCRVLDEMGADMAYFDQVSCSQAKPCFNPAHGHPLGGGKWWADGYRQMFEAIHDYFEKRGAAVTSEQLGEAWLDIIDAYLNATELTDEDVPLFPAIYQSYCVHFGRRVGCDKPHQTRTWRFLQDAKTVLWGEAPGWIGAHVFAVRHYADEAANLLAAARFRREHADFLVFGSLENELVFAEDDPNVYGTVWTNASEDRTAAALVNASEHEKRIRYRFPDERNFRETLLAPRQLKMELRDNMQ